MYKSLWSNNVKILAMLCPLESGSNLGSAMLCWTTISSTASPLSASKEVQLYAMTKSEFDYESPRLALSYERVPKSHSLNTLLLPYIASNSYMLIHKRG